MKTETDKYLKSALVFNKDLCWVCVRQFVDSGGFDAIRNSHHIIPSANGGLNGPQVMLCSECHDTLHALATQLLAEHKLKQKEDLPKVALCVQGALDKTTSPNKDRLGWLISRVIVSTLLVSGDPNKRTKFSCTLTGKEQVMLDELKKVMLLKSREAVIKALIEKAHKSTFSL